MVSQVLKKMMGPGNTHVDELVLLLLFVETDIELDLLTDEDEVLLLDEDLWTFSNDISRMNFSH